MCAISSISSKLTPCLQDEGRHQPVIRSTLLSAADPRSAVKPAPYPSFAERPGAASHYFLFSLISLLRPFSTD